MRPGDGVMIAIRSARYTASSMSVVTVDDAPRFSKPSIDEMLLQRHAVDRVDRRRTARPMSSIEASVSAQGARNGDPMLHAAGKADNG